MRRGGACDQNDGQSDEDYRPLHAPQTRFDDMTAPTGDSWAKKAETQYFALVGYAELRQSVLSGMLHPYVAVTDLYGKLICEITLILGTTPPGSKLLMERKSPDAILDTTIRDLMADVFDFLYEARGLILKGKLEVAFPLARRAYEALSLLVACYLEPKIAKRWNSRKEVSNADVRGILGKHPLGELEEKTRELNKFFAGFSHPNRRTMPSRRLGDGNEFVLGAIGTPSLTMLADYALKTLNLWFWFGAVIHWIYLPILIEVNPTFKQDCYDEAANKAKEVTAYFAEQFARVLAQEKAEQNRERRRQGSPEAAG
jgi:hypothetical protein